MNPLHERWETKDRFYEIWIDKDLFGDWIITRHWGGLNTSRKAGGIQKTTHFTDAEVKKSYEAAVKRRIEHHYKKVAVRTRQVCLSPILSQTS
jgi:hypothetical protein